MEALNLILVVDVESKFQKAEQQGRPFSSFALARDLSQVARSHGPRTRSIAIVSKHDEASLKEMPALGYEVLAVNGDRPQAVQTLQTELGRLVALRCTEKLIIVSPDPSFTSLGQRAARQTRVAIWGDANCPAQKLPAEIDTRSLDEVIRQREQHNIDVRLDYENLHFGLLKERKPYAPQVIINAIKRMAEGRGKIVGMHAYGDFSAVRIPAVDINIQRELVMMGVKTHYQVNCWGKNAADMEIANDLRTLVDSRQGAEVDEVWIGTGDRDLQPIVETLRAMGKKVVLVSLEGCLSSFLRAAADEVLYLDEELTRLGQGI